MPWSRSFISGILIAVVLIDIWMRQANVFGVLWTRLRGPTRRSRPAFVAAK